MICSVLIAAVLLVGLQNGTIKKMILPGDSEVTAAAFGALINDLCSGEGFREAVTAFCIEVMEHAKIVR